MKRFAMIATVAAVMAAPVSAQTFRAENRVNVTPVQGGFNISSGGGFGARGMWCAAADYARDALGARGTQRIYVTGPRTKSNRRAPVRFSLSPSGTTPVAVSIVGASLRTAGSSLSVDHAQSFCTDARLINR